MRIEFLSFRSCKFRSAKHTRAPIKRKFLRSSIFLLEPTLYVLRLPDYREWMSEGRTPDNRKQRSEEHSNVDP